jgi:hypothetical protein
MNFLGCEFICAADIVHIIGVAPVDKNITGFDQWNEVCNGFVDNCGGYHQPQSARFLQFLCQVGERRRTHCIFPHQVIYHLLRPVIDHALVAVPD